MWAGHQPKRQARRVNSTQELIGKIGNNGIIQALFNPNSYSVSKPISWRPEIQSSMNTSKTRRDLNAPPVGFGGGGSRTLSLELFYDVTENDKIDDVRKETNKIVLLTQIERKRDQPPLCEVTWGESPPDSDLTLQGVREQSDAAVHPF